MSQFSDRRKVTQFSLFSWVKIRLLVLGWVPRVALSVTLRVPLSALRQPADRVEYAFCVLRLSRTT